MKLLTVTQVTKFLPKWGGHENNNCDEDSDDDDEDEDDDDDDDDDDDEGNDDNDDEGNDDNDDGFDYDYYIITTLYHYCGTMDCQY